MIHDGQYMAMALDQARTCTPDSSSYCVGAVLVKEGKVIGTGYSRARGRAHAEEIALKDASADPSGATLYTTMEPCSKRESSPVSCTDLIIRAHLARVVFAAHEPPTLQRCEGEKLLRRAGLAIVHLKPYQNEALAIATRTS